jgi:hypothetical protein
MQNESQKRALRFTALLVPGAALGWMVGMSVSPVAQTIVTAVGTVLLGAVSALAGVRTESKAANGPTQQVHVSPISFVLLWLALGSAFGVYTRTHDWLSAPRAVSSVAQTSDEQHKGVLYSTSISECAGLRLALARGDLRNALLAVSDKHTQDFARQVVDPAMLTVAPRELICPTDQK